MTTTTIQNTTVGSYINITSLSGISGSVVLTNLSSSPLYLVVSATQPVAETKGVVCWSGEEVFINNTSSSNIWAIAQHEGPILVQSGMSASAEYRVANLPSSLLTNGPEGVQRIRVDVAQTGFFYGREARTFKHGSLASGAAFTIKVSLPVDVILNDVSLIVSGGSMSLSTLRAPVFSGTFGTPVAVIPKNTTSSRPTPYYVPQTVLTTGGTATGQEIDYLKVVSATATAQITSVGGKQFSERGVGAGEYAWVFTNTSNSTVDYEFSAWWEERP